MVSGIVALRLEGSPGKITGGDEPDVSIKDCSHLRDDEILSHIDSMDSEELVARGNYASSKGMMKHYCTLHREWIEKFDYYLGEDVGCQPNEEELIGNPEFNKMCQRFRVFYGMKHPDKIDWLNGDNRV